VLVLARLRGLDKENEVVQREKEEILRAIAIESKEEGRGRFVLGIMELRRTRDFIWRWGFSLCSR